MQTVKQIVTGSNAVLCSLASLHLTLLQSWVAWSINYKNNLFRYLIADWLCDLIDSSDYLILIQLFCVS